MDERDRQIEAMTKQILDLTIMVNMLTGTIAELQETIRELRRQLGQNSQNSSKPPSSDGYNKPSPKSQRTKSGKKPGGQKGHPGTHMSIPHEPNQVRQHLPEKCEGCPKLSECLKKGNVFKCAEKRYVVDLSIQTTVTEHQTMNVKNCPCGNGEIAGAFPENVKAYVQYGDSVTMAAGLLNTYGAMSVERIHSLMKSQLGISLSTGTIISMVKRCGEKVLPMNEMIRILMPTKDVCNFDETGIRVNGKLYWVHNASTPELTYQTVHQNRGKDGIDDNGVIRDFHGTAVHDCWSPYWKYEGVRHAICCAHLLRELTGIEEYTGHKWAEDFKKLLLAMKKTKDNAVRKEKTKLSYYHLHKFDKEYERIMKLADSECPPPENSKQKKRGRVKKGKERSPIERLIALKEAICLFAHDFRIPFDNNQAERDLRNVKTKSKIIGCFRTENGAQNYLNIMSYLSTGLKHGFGVVEALSAAFAGNGDIVLQPGF